MKSLFEFFVKNWRFSLVTTLMFFIVGGLGATLMRREAFPPVNFAAVFVSTIYPGAAPQEVHDRVTQPLEDELRGINGIKDVRSISQNERSEISIRIDIDGKDSDQVVTDIQRAVQRAAYKLPSDILDAPLVSELKAEEIPILEVGIVGNNEARVREKLAETLEEAFEDVAGVKDVRLSGYRKREIQIQLNTAKLASLQVGMTEVTQALSNQLRDVPAGFIRSNDQIKLVRIMGKTSNVTEVENILVRVNEEGGGVKIRDIGKVVDGSEKDTLLARLNGQEATLLTISKKEDADAVSTIKSLRLAQAAFEKSLPPGYQIVVYNDEGARVENRLQIVEFNGLAGLIVVLLVLFLFLPGKVGMASALSLPICTLMTLSVMVMVGAQFNIITMLALIICLGNLVDNSVVISEYYTSQREQGVGHQEAAIEAASKFWIPFTASTITIIAAFLPMLVTQGVLGQFIKWIPIVVCIALTASLIESLSLLPARLQFLSIPSRSSGTSAENDLELLSSGWFGKVEAKWGKIVEWTVYRRWKTLGILSGVVVSGFLVTGLFNRFELFPSEGDEYYVLRYDLPQGSSIRATDASAAWLSSEVERVLGKDILRAVIARSGVQQTDPGDPTSKAGEHVGVIVIAIKPEIAPTLNIAETLNKLRSIEKKAPLVKLSAETIANGPPVGKPLTITLRSSDYQELRNAANEMKSKIGPIAGVVNLEDDEEKGGPELRFVPETSTLRFAGLSLESVGFNLRTSLEGFTAAEMTEAGRDFEIKVRLGDENRSSAEQLQNTQFLNNRGVLVPLKLVGRLEGAEPSSVIKNFNYKQAITLTSEVDVKQITSVKLNDQAREIFTSIQSKYLGISAVFGGEEEATNDSLKSLGIALVLAIFLIFATLVFTFQSFSSPLLILSTIPLGLVGVFYAFAIDQRPLSFLAFIGVVGLSGVVINSAIILIDYIEELRRDPKWKKLDLQRLLVLASRRRLRAVLATGLTTVVGLVPTAFGLGGYDPILVPMTLALSWGMIVGTVLSLLWIPAGYQVLQELKGLALERVLRWKNSGFRNRKSGSD
jgi:multidrug efflux pump subunit AcrB